MICVNTTAENRNYVLVGLVISLYRWCGSIQAPQGFSQS